MNEGALADSFEASTHLALGRARERQEAMLRVFQALVLLAVILVEATGISRNPAPDLSGTGLAVSIALLGFALGSIGAAFVTTLPELVATALIATLALSSGALDSLQSGGFAVVGSFVAAGAAGIRLPRLSSAVVLGTALVALAVPAVLTAGESLGSLVLNGTGVAAFYAMGELANRLRTGQELASRLLAELEASQRERADAAVLAERQRVAREMHDVLAHSLSGLVLQLEAARLLTQRRDAEPELAAAVDRSLHLGKEGLAEARRAIGMLRGDVLPGAEALSGLVSQFEHDTGVPCSIDVSGDERVLDAAASLTLFRVAQEALTNVRRHAHPKSVELRLAYEPDGTRLTVEDFGDEGATSPVLESAGAGYGITGMRERAELLGGRFEACATPSGFRVELWVST